MTISEKKYILLLVEDDPSTRDSFRKILTLKGFSVLTASDAMEAFDVLESNPIDLILSDINMPGIDGFTFRKMVLSNFPLRDIPFIFVTARSQAEDQVRGMEQGAEVYLTKPIEPDVLAAHIRAAIARRENYARMSRLDALTGFLNRWWVAHEIDKELRRQDRFNNVGSLVFLDLDDFKQINDLYGHACGDAVLLQLAEVLKKNTRTIDILGRYGGEEFILYLPKTTKPDAVKLVERLLELFRHCGMTEGTGRLSFSAGVVESPMDGKDFQTLCMKADQAMYEAKRQGKAQVTPWREPVGEFHERKGLLR